MKPNRASIVALRELSGLTQRALAEKAGISAPTLNEIESGRGAHKGVSPKSAAKIAAALHVPISAIAWPSNCPADPEDEVAA